MSQKVEVSSICIKVGANDIHLTLEEAKELSDVLSNLFQKEIIKIKEYYPTPWTYRHWNDRTQPYDWTLTCAGNNLTLCKSKVS